MDPGRLMTIDDVVRAHPVAYRTPCSPPEFPSPPLSRSEADFDTHVRRKVVLAVESFRRHMTDEGWQMQEGLECSGYDLVGPNLPIDERDAAAVLERMDPATVIVQDQREWDPSMPGCFDRKAAFVNVPALRERQDVLRVAVHKDVHQSPDYHKASHASFDPHLWITYYHPALVKHFCPWTRERHVLRTTHSLDPGKVPSFSHFSRNIRALLSGSLSGYYPLRQRVHGWVKTGLLPGVSVVPHPGYHARGSRTDDYLRMLSQTKVAICTSSRLGFTLRKLIEATACGCVVVTDLPPDDPMDEIDQNFVRVSPAIDRLALQAVVDQAVRDYDPARQGELAARAIARYDFRVVGRKLADLVEGHRRNYA